MDMLNIVKICIVYNDQKIICFKCCILIVYIIFFIIDKNSKIDEEKKNYLNNVRNYFDQNFLFIFIQLNMMFNKFNLI